ncbi:MAG: Nicotinate-nucleotide--dimethylbenzimidazole phosphoribosyltransferase [Pelosinus sp.]|jgi:nicotinate-nucleotide--dimethylbenzimidazole phosphoribosyltransferase|nr:Nicotinate-nucleotide--dimethylbenzimidazole phosphoribosyltransferase [Pelosinus sp.]
MIQDTISSIKPLDTVAMEKCQIRLDNLTKPLGSLHALEHLARQLSGITGNPRPRTLKKSILIMAGDHGVATEELTASPQVATVQRVHQLSQGSAAINIFAAHVAADLLLVDMGIADEIPSLPSVRNEKIACATNNITQGPAMTREQAIKAIEIGITIANEEIKKGANVLGVGEMGIANTISSAAIIACYSQVPVATLAGEDSNLSQGLFDKKVAIINHSITINSPNRNDPVDVLAKLGGFETAGLVGVILGAAAGKASIVLDGLVTSAAALLAVKMAPQVKDYLIGSHFPPEPAHKVALDLIGIPAHLHLNISSGEGIGAALGMSLLNASLHVLNDMKTFGDAEVAVAQDGPGALKQDKNVKD